MLRTLVSEVMVKWFDAIYDNTSPRPNIPNQTMSLAISELKWAVFRSLVLNQSIQGRPSFGFNLGKTMNITNIKEKSYSEVMVCL